jgi:hypothetical protein
MASPTDVLVVDREGAPMAGSGVQVVQDVGNVRPDSECSDFDLDRMSGNLGRSHPVLVRLEKAVADEAGRVRLDPLSGTPGIGLRVEGSRHRPALAIPPPHPGPDGAVRIVVVRGATLSGTISPPAILERLARRGLRGDLEPSVTLYRLEPSRLQWPNGREGPEPDAMGRFRIEGIPVGRWQIELRAWVGNTNAPIGILGEVTLAGDEIRDVALDASSLVPTWVEGRACVDGRPRVGLDVEFLADAVTTEGEPWLKLAGKAETDSEGAFASWVLPGRMRVVLAGRHPETGREFRIQHPEVFDLLPDQKLNRTFDVPWVAARIRLVWKDGVPAAGTRIEGELPGNSTTQHRRRGRVADDRAGARLAVPPLDVARGFPQGAAPQGALEGSREAPDRPR